MENKYQNLYDVFHRYAVERPGKRFVFDEERSFSASESFSVTETLARTLLSCGVRSQDVVVLKAERNIPVSFLFLALQFIGALTVLTDSHDSCDSFLSLSSSRIDYRFQIFHKADATLWDGYVLKDNQGRETPLVFTFSNALSPDPELTPVFHKTLSENPSAIIFTTGSTGKKKPVLLSQEALLNASRLTVSLSLYEETDIGIVLLPLYHIFGIFLILSAILTFHSLYFPPTKEIPAIREAIPRYGITRMDTVPTFFLALVEELRSHPTDVSTLRMGLIGGGPSTSSQLEMIEKTLGILLIPVYGMTECLGISSGTLEQTRHERLTTLGRIFPEDTVILIDDHGNTLSSCGQTGEILVKGPAQMLGYYKDDVATHLIRDDKGFLHTGDLGFIDASGNLNLAGRKKDLIIRGGENISPRRILETILSLPYVQNAVVVGKEDPHYGEVPCALVVLRKGETVTEERLRKDLTPMLFKNEIPSRILFSETIPLLDNGKIDSQAVKKCF